MIEAKKAIALVQNKLAAWLEALVGMLPNLALAAVTVIVFWLLARLARYVSKNIFKRFFLSASLARLFNGALYGTVLLIGIFAALSILQLDKTVTSLLAGAGILGLALGFAFQDIVSNFIAGILMAAQRPLEVGDLVETSGEIGIVKRIDLRTTQLRNLQGLQVIIPNKDIFQTNLINFSRNGTRRLDIGGRVSYKDDLAHVKKVAIDAVGALEEALPDHAVELFYQKFAESSIDFEIRFWISASTNREFQSARSNAITAIKEAFDREGISMPFPIRTMDLGNKGDDGSDPFLAILD